MDLLRRDVQAHAKCNARIRRLAALGHELRRPEADYLRDGLYELRARRGHVNYRKKTKDALVLLARDAGDDPSYWRRVEQEVLNAQVAQAIYDARTAAKLTQKQLAELVGTTQPVIARLEDADYNGHSLTMLRRIAEALGRRVEVRLVPKRRTLQRS